LINSYLTKRIIDSLNGLEGARVVSVAALPSILILLNFELHNLSWRGINAINLKLMPKVKSGLIKSLFAHVHTRSYSFFQETLSGSISHNIMILSDTIEQVGSNTSVRLIRGTTQLVAALIGMYFVHPLFSGALLTWTACFVSISILFSKKISVFSNEYAKSQSVVSGSIVDSVANFSSVRFFAQQRFESSYVDRFLGVMKEKFQKKEGFLLRFYFVQGFSITCLVGFIVYSLLRLRAGGLVTIGDFAFILGAALYVTENVWATTEQIDQFNDAIGRCRQCLQTLFGSTEIKEKVGAKPLVVRDGEITFKKVKFHYKDTAPLFENKSVVIHPGEKVGIVGYSGSGKSTFLNLLFRLYDVDSGSILIDGQDIRDVTIHSLHSSIRVIPQEPSLFHRSLMENIRYGNLEASDEAVVEAAKKAHADSFISELPDGYASLLGERGIKLSGGQRQRIAIARALLKNSPILVLDEATSQLDSVTENLIKKGLVELMKKKTTLIIAHRLSTLLHVDRILVFDKGKIVEDGKHETLLSQSGIYKKLWDAQMDETKIEFV
jgi:ATP-binding cassette subfamily B protein